MQRHPALILSLIKVTVDSLSNYLYFESTLNFALLELRIIHQEIGSLRDENKKQNTKIAHLEEVIESQEEKMDQKITKELDQRMMMKVLKEDENQNRSLPEKVRNKRPYRLLPFKTNYNDVPGDAIKDGRSINPNRHRFYGPPTSCFDLSQLGYTLNGFYLVQLVNITTETKVETVYCAFEQPEGTSLNQSIVEKRGDYLKLNDVIIRKRVGGGIHFYAHMIQDGQLNFKVSSSGNLIFRMVFLNMGRAFNEKTGTFTAPINGVYQFIFKGTTSKEVSSVVIGLFRNSDLLTYTKPSADSNVIVATLKLTKGDRIYLKTLIGNGNILTLLGDSTASFSGSLLEELE